MNYTIETIADFCHGRSQIAFPGSVVSRINIDHRNLQRDNALFAAIPGSRFDGHDFIPELIDYRGHHFLISDAEVAKRYEGRANFIIVDDVVKALQMIARGHRENFELPVIAITGSNGKTIVKEWLNTLLEGRYEICRSPKSFNSQIGVPLSVFELGSNDSLGIFEAGISLPDEMVNLRNIIQPTIGLFTNLGDAHAAHFRSYEHKWREKWCLFEGVQTVVACEDQTWTRWLTPEQRGACFFWSTKNNEAPVFIEISHQGLETTILKASTSSGEFSFGIPFTDRISIENASHCFTMLHHLGKTQEEILGRFEHLSPVAMRMEVKQGVEGALIIDDTYNADLFSLKASIDQLATHADRDKWVVLSDLKDTDSFRNTYKEIAEMLREADVTRLIAIGPELAMHKALFEPIVVHTYPDVHEFLEQFDPKSIANKVLLVKGARKFTLEKLVNRLQAKQRITTLEIDLEKLGQNLHYFKKKLQPGTGIMVMVKAFAYGSGSFEIAHYFQQQNVVDYLVVAYADEGVVLREKGINLPILVMSASKTAYETMLQHNLEPEIFSINSLRDFLKAARSMRHYFDMVPVHIKLDTGMHRLGLEGGDLAEAVKLIKEAGFIKVASVFTHLSASEDAEQDDFTHLQVNRFEKMYRVIADSLGYSPLRHVLNSTGVLRFPQYHFELVRLGIGLYGFSGNHETRFLNTLGSLKSYIVQVREVAAGESVGYGRRGMSDHTRKIATVALGYADGLDRRLSHGLWNFIWQGVECPIVGSICMDLTMIDVTHTDAREGDEVIVFEGNASIEAMASILGTIPYEILTKIPERVRRIYLQE